MKRFLFLAMVVAAATGCSAQAADNDVVGEASSEIIGGTLDNGDPSVVYIVMDGKYGCSGSVISSTVVLTAAHCLAGFSSFEVRTGTKAGSSPTSKLAVKEVHAHPSYDPNGAADQKYDIGVIVLSNATSLSPLTIGRTALTNSAVGKDVRLVGYGWNDGVSKSGGGVKREITVAVKELKSDDFSVGEYGRTSCHGDSGGPAFLDGKIVGVTSYGYDYPWEACIDSGFYTRVDLYTSFIDQYTR
ncbi:trypsin-like serine protease [Pendulispora rubella]|uniref:Trypsin-like serine protease n=1 Tax=Pendulispora rubella TaxID=2741070 RepID=A0ABZ2L590_9BACT